MNSWDKKMNSAKERFRVLSAFNNEAVLDRETGLVWERSPMKQALLWPNARLVCAQKDIGGRGGWRLPAFNENLTSLVDPAVAVSGVPRLPGGPSVSERASECILVSDNICGRTGLCAHREFSICCRK